MAAQNGPLSALELSVGPEKSAGHSFGADPGLFS
jgi:hypothetical protein